MTDQPEPTLHQEGERQQPVRRADRADGGPTTVEKLKGMPWSIASNASNTVFAQYTFYGSLFVLFLSALGLSKSQMGAILSLLADQQRAARDALTRATLARAEADELRNLSVNDAARIIAAKRAEQEQTRRLLEQRERQLNPFQRTTPGSDPGRDGPARGL